MSDLLKNEIKVDALLPAAMAEKAKAIGVSKTEMGFSQAFFF